MTIPGELVLWPGVRSYTRQPAGEFHTLGSPPLLSAVVEQLCRCGARAALPGEFTLRAFLAGRIDLVQAEAVLGVIDAQGGAELDAALDQLAGGLSGPLHRVREQLLDVLAELEAGLDFAEEDVEFIGREQLLRQLAAGHAVVAATLAQMAARDRRGEAPRAVLAGAANAGKSSLFNTLVQRYGVGAPSRAIVSPIAGATRDYLVAALDLDGVQCELIDAAGDGAALNDIARLSQDTATVQRRAADVRLQCIDVTAEGAIDSGQAATDIVALTKVDLAIGGDRATALADPVAQKREAAYVRCSSVTGDGIVELAAMLRQRIAALGAERGNGAAAATAARCVGSLGGAARALSAASDLVETGAGAELVAAELRAALAEVGQVVGAVCADDVLDRVFSQFCIGK